MPVQPETRYARSGDVNVAYQVPGEGPVDIVYVDVISHLELVWEIPSHPTSCTGLLRSAA